MDYNTKIFTMKKLTFLMIVLTLYSCSKETIKKQRKDLIITISVDNQVSNTILIR